jgi:two-component system sensor histidine kinase YesM
MTSIVIEFYIGSMVKREISHISDSAQVTKKMVQDILDSVSSLSKTIKDDNDIIEEMTTSNGGTLVTLRSFAYIYPYVSNIYIMGESGVLFSSENIEDKYDDALAYFNGYFEKMRKSCRSDAFYEDYYSLAKIDITYVSIETSSNGKTWRILITLDYQAFYNIYYQTCVMRNQCSFITSETGNIIASYPHTTVYLPVLVDYPEFLVRKYQNFIAPVWGYDRIIVVEPLDFCAWNIVVMVFESEVFQYTSKLYKTLVIALILLTLFTLLLSLLFALHFSKPIAQLKTGFSLLEKGDFSVRLQPKHRDEFGNLQYSFNHMAARLKNLMDRTMENEKNKAELEYKVLQSQINPHFIYNTLDSIKWMATIRHVDSISEMTSALIQLLRYNLSTQKDRFTLADEIESVKKYFIIQKFRFNDFIMIDYRLNPDTLRCIVPRLILQPIVENSIQHGFVDNEDGGTILISSWLDNEGHLLVSVKDNGCGSKDTDINQLGKHTSSDTSIGLQNVNNRLKLFFGAPYGISLYPVSSGGLEVRFFMPRIT